MNETTDDSYRFLITYLHLRKVIGLLAISLPFILLIGNMMVFDEYNIQDSISHYYYTEMRDIFVGVLFAFGIFLFSYRGYEPKDNLVGNFACLFAVGIALFPTSQDPANIAGYIHATSAALFFLTLSYFSLHLFTKTDNATPSPRQKLRKKIYKTCGLIMLICMGIVIIYFALPESAKESLSAYKPIFFLETIMIFAFGISWFTKGKGILADEK